MDDYWDILEGVSLFQGVGKGELSSLLDCLGARVGRYSKGAAILREGAPATHIGIVLAGEARVSRAGADGNRLLMAAIAPGELFAEAYACAKAEALPLSVHAGVDSVILFLNCQRILTPCASSCQFHTRLVGNLMLILAEKNIRLSQTLEHLSQRTLREKLLSYLGAQAVGGTSFVIPFDRQSLADYLCCDRSALSREIGKLRAEGVILQAEGRAFQLAIR